MRRNSAITATRAQLELLRGANPRSRPLGLRLFPPRVLAAAGVLSNLAIGTSPREASPGSLLFLQEVPPGAYHVHVAHRPEARGELMLGIGRASVRARRAGP